VRMRTYAGPPLTLACSDVVHGGVGAGSLGDPRAAWPSYRAISSTSSIRLTGHLTRI